MFISSCRNLLTWTRFCACWPIRTRAHSSPLLPWRKTASMTRSDCLLAVYTCRTPRRLKELIHSGLMKSSLIELRPFLYQLSRITDTSLLVLFQLLLWLCTNCWKKVPNNGNCLLIWTLWLVAHQMEELYWCLYWCIYCPCPTNCSCQLLLERGLG